MSFVADRGFWGEDKQRCNVMLTPTAKDKLTKISTQLELSRSEVLERLIRLVGEPEKLSIKNNLMLENKYINSL